jgi:nicotinamide-nucleotide amidase
MTENNIKQAYLPENSMIIRNSNGTAPGCIIEEGGKVVVMLPGPPSEMKPMFEETVIPYFEKLSAYKLVSRYVRIFGIGESAVEDRLMDLIDNQTNPTIAPYAKEGEVTLRVTARYDRDGKSEDIIEPVVNEIKNRLGIAVYSAEDRNLEEVAADLLVENKKTISIAESCTGGLISSRLTDIPGISRVFDRAIISYSNESKINNLGVSEATLEKHGAVSAETACEMAEGVRRMSETDIGVSITGIAGPDGGTEEKPVGLVFIALSSEKGTRSKELRLWGSRARIRNVTALYVFDMIRQHLLS